MAGLRLITAPRRVFWDMGEQKIAAWSCCRSVFSSMQGSSTSSRTGASTCLEIHCSLKQGACFWRDQSKLRAVGWDRGLRGGGCCAKFPLASKAVCPAECRRLQVRGAAASSPWLSNGGEQEPWAPGESWRLQGGPSHYGEWKAGREQLRFGSVPL